MPILRIELSTPVKGHYQAVMRQFDQTLFDQLTPPGAGVELVRFDGSKQGDIVHIRLKLLGFIKQDWISEIIADDTDDQQTYFIDEGTQLPFFLTYWKHKHIVRANGPDKSIIIDDIQFRTPFFLMDFLLYPVLWLQFAYRKPIYRRIFGR